MPYEVTIEDVKLFPQGYSAIAMHPELIRGEPSILLMDIGRWTVDLMRLDNGVPDAASCRSLEQGMIRCVDEIREQVRRDTGLSITDAQIEGVLSEKACSMEETARKEELETTLRRVLQKELKTSHYHSATQQEEVIPQEIMGFLDSLLGEE